VYKSMLGGGGFVGSFCEVKIVNKGGGLSGGLWEKSWCSTLMQPGTGNDARGIQCSSYSIQRKKGTEARSLYASGGRLEKVVGKKRPQEGENWGEISFWFLTLDYLLGMKGSWLQGEGVMFAVGIRSRVGGDGKDGG